MPFSHYPLLLIMPAEPTTDPAQIPALQRAAAATINAYNRDLNNPRRRHLSLAPGMGPVTHTKSPKQDRPAVTYEIPYAPKRRYGESESELKRMRREQRNVRSDLKPLLEAVKSKLPTGYIAAIEVARRSYPT